MHVREGAAVTEAGVGSVHERTARTGQRVVYVLNRYPVLSQTFVRDEVAALRAAGVEVDVLALEEGGDPLGGPEARTVLRPAPPLLALRSLAWWSTHHPLRLARALGAAARSGDYRDVALRALPTVARQLLRADRPAPPTNVHAHFAWGASSVAGYLGTLLGVPATVTAHAKDIYLDVPRARRRMDALRAVVTVCDYNVRHLREVVGLPPSTPVFVVPCAVEPVEAVPAPPGGPDVVSVGRLVQKKGFATLLRAVAEVRRELPDVRVEVVGDGPLREQLERCRADLGIERNVTFAGALDHRATLARIEAGRVFCLASEHDDDGDSDALPVVIREAMVRARPVVTTAVAGIPETVEDGRSGWVVPEKDVHALARALLQALRDPGEAQERGLAGRRRALREWTSAGQAEQLRRVFGSLG